LPGVRFLLPAALAFVLAACGGGSGSQESSPATQKGARLPAWVKQALAAKAGPDVAVTMGSSDFAVGDNRVVFLVVRGDGGLGQAPTATIRYATAGGTARRAAAVLQPLGAHEQGKEDERQPLDHHDGTQVYLALL
jgi:hypothetical protein